MSTSNLTYLKKRKILTYLLVVIFLFVNLSSAIVSAQDSILADDSVIIIDDVDGEALDEDISNDGSGINEDSTNENNLEEQAIDGADNTTDTTEQSEFDSELTNHEEDNINQPKDQEQNNEIQEKIGVDEEGLQENLENDYSIQNVNLTEIFVSPNGNDVTNTGTIDSPYKTIAKAIDTIEDGTASEISTIYLRAGTYNTGSDININARNYITITNYGNETVEVMDQINILDSYYINLQGLKIIRPSYDNAIFVRKSWYTNIFKMDIVGRVHVYDSRYSVIESCLFHNYEISGAVTLNWAKYTQVYNNVIYNNEYGAAILESEQNAVYNNTFYGNKNKDIFFSGSSTKNNLIKNNIFTSGLQLQTLNMINEAGVKNEIDNNCYSMNGETIAAIVAGEEKTFDEFKGLEGNPEANGILGDAIFVDVENFNYQIGRNSVCIDKADTYLGLIDGGKVQVYAPEIDIAENQRKDLPDIGAYEHIVEENKFYVSVNGDNNNDGSIESPFRTITHALAVIPSNSELIIRGGTYTDEAAVLNGKSEIVISNYDNENVSIVNQADKYFSISKCSDITIKGLNIAYSSGKSTNVLIASDSSNIDVLDVHFNGGDMYFLRVDTFKLYSSTFTEAKGDSGITARDCKNGMIFNNISYNNANYGIYLLGNSTNNSIYNNTFAKNAKGDIYILSHSSLGTPTNNKICNNIVTRGLFLHNMNNADTVALNQFDYNAYDENLAGNIGSITATHPNGISLEDFKALPSAPEQNAVIGKISFIDSSINDFRLKGDSICIGNGTSIDAPTHDYRGLERIKEIDIGAYQFSENDVFKLAIVSYNPQGQSNSIDTPIIVDFNNSISTDNIEGIIKVTDPSGNEVPGSISVEDKTVTFTPSIILEHQTIYSVTVNGNIKDVDNNILSTSFSWEFRTRIGKVNNSLRASDMTSNFGHARREIGELPTDEYYVTFDYMYPSGQTMENFFVWTSHNGEEYVDTRIMQYGSLLKVENGPENWEDLDIKISADTWYNFMLYFKDDGTFELYINGKKALIGNERLRSGRRIAPGKKMNAIGYIGDIRTAYHDGCAFFDNFKIYTAESIVFEEDFNDGNLDGWEIYGSTDLADPAVDYSKVKLDNVNINTSTTGLLIGASTDINLSGLLSNGKEVDLAVAEKIDITSSDESVAKVEFNEGIFTIVGVGEGRAQITANIRYKGEVGISSVDIIVSETPIIHKLKLESDNNKLLLNDSSNIKLYGLYTDEGIEEIQIDKSVELSSSNTDILQIVEDNGVKYVKAVGYGQADIIAKKTINELSMETKLGFNVVGLKEIIANTLNPNIFVGNWAGIDIELQLDDDSKLDISKADKVSISSGDSDIIVYEELDGQLGIKAISSGNSDIIIEVTLRDITKSAQLTFAVDELTNSKTKSTYYTAEKVAAARENVEKYDWAKSTKDAIVARAEQYLKLDYDFLWELVPAQTIPRSYAVNEALGCPHCGKEIDKYGNYPYIIDPVNNPWKLECPNCSAKFPTNDFESYYKSGLNKYGKFDPELANKEFLVNVSEEFKDKGEKWGVDDGYGFVDEDGNKYTFIAYYAHWGLWYGGGIIYNALATLRDAYLLTGQSEYAKAGIILLDRVADIYPELSTLAYSTDDGYKHSGWWGRGKAVGAIWETSIARNFALAYDAFFPAMDDPEVMEDVLEFLGEKAEQYNLGVLKKSATGIRRNMEDGILRQIYKDVTKGLIAGNNGMHQRALTAAAIILDCNPETKEWLDFNFQAGGQYFEGVTGGDILSTFVDKIDRDGNGQEGSPHYNSLWLSMYLEIADFLDGYELYPEADLYKNVKFRKMFHGVYPFILSDIYTANIGDTNNTGMPVSYQNKAQYIKAFEKFREPIFAQLVYFLGGDSFLGVNTGIYSKDPEKIVEDMQKVIDEYGPLKLESDNLTGFGFAALRDGERGEPEKVNGYKLYFCDMEEIEKSVDNTYYDTNRGMQLEAFNAGEFVEYEFEVPEEYEYDLSILHWRAPTYGVYDIIIDGGTDNEVKIATNFDFYGSQSKITDFGKIHLTKGAHRIRFECTGKDLGTNYKMAVIQLLLLKETEGNQDVVKDTQRDVWMYYGLNMGHGHYDTLNIGMHAFGLDISPELGYPEYARHDWPHTSEWIESTISHNTVLVDKTMQAGQWIAFPKHFDDGDLVKLVDVEAPKAYPQTQTYRRTTAMIKVDNENSYTVDLFRVKGGKEHHFSFHGSDAIVTTEGLNLIKQVDENGNYIGSYAGPEVEFGVRPLNDSVPGENYRGSGFHWLKNVEKDTNPSNMFSVNWNVKDTWDVYGRGAGAETDVNLRLTMLGDFSDVALADGVPPRNKPGNPASLRYLIAHREGEKLDSLFLSVIEPYKGQRFVESISPIALTVDGEAVSNNDARAVKVTLKNGRVDYIVNAINPDITYTVDGKFQFKGFFGVYSEKDGEYVASYINDGELIGEEMSEVQSRLTGTVVDFTKEMSIENEIKAKVNETGFDANDLAGRFIYIDNDKVRNAVYKIKGVKAIEEDIITLDIGDLTPIRSWKDVNDFSQGFVYDFAEGASFAIPLSYEINHLAELEDTSLEYIKVGNEILPGFKQDKYKFTVKLPFGVITIPPVTAKATNKDAIVDVTQASQVPGKALVKVTAADGVTVKTYEVEFVYELDDELFQVGDVKFTDPAGKEITSLIGGTDIKGSVEITNNTERVVPAIIIVALFDKDDRIVNYSTASQQIGSNAVINLEVGFRLPVNVEGHKIKAFVWDSWEGMKPLSNMVSFPQE